MATADDVRRIALSEATEELAWGMPAFRVGGRSSPRSATTPRWASDVRRRAGLIAAEPGKFFPREGHDGHFGRLRVRLAALDGARELSAILADSWRQVAPRKIQDAHPAPGG
ncbi:MmcQ/YjbR family DNA-binding protein [Streptomyces mauvecolor]